MLKHFVMENPDDAQAILFTILGIAWYVLLTEISIYRILRNALAKSSHRKADK